MRELAERTAGRRGSKVEVAIDDDGVGEGASSSLFQVIREALDQAIRRGPPTAVSVSLTQTAKGGVELVISDDGAPGAASGGDRRPGRACGRAQRHLRGAPRRPLDDDPARVAPDRRPPADSLARRDSVEGDAPVARYASATALLQRLVLDVVLVGVLLDERIEDRRALRECIVDLDEGLPLVRERVLGEDRLDRAFRFARAAVAGEDAARERELVLAGNDGAERVLRLVLLGIDASSPARRPRASRGRASGSACCGHRSSSRGFLPRPSRRRRSPRTAPRLRAMRALRDRSSVGATSLLCTGSPSEATHPSTKPAMYSESAVSGSSRLRLHTMPEQCPCPHSQDGCREKARSSSGRRSL